MDSAWQIQFATYFEDCSYQIFNETIFLGYIEMFTNFCETGLFENK